MFYIGHQKHQTILNILVINFVIFENKRFVNEDSYYKKIDEQAGAELCQAQSS